MLENNGLFDIIKTAAEVLVAPFIAFVTYLFAEIRGVKSKVSDLELKVAEKYLTKQEFREFEDKIFDKIDEHKQESIRQHTDIATKLNNIENRLFSIISGKSVDNS